MRELKSNQYGESVLFQSFLFEKKSLLGSRPHKVGGYRQSVLQIFSRRVDNR
jgi:hypothetical protein